ncbi:MAG: glycosyltransferase family 4 protein [Pyrinomonadaceae bacterium]|nr:glycosyltransferase family 4 protein [Pyrinomonadaceae bacterium]
MKSVNYISNLDLNQKTGGWSGVNVSLHGMLSKRFDLNSIGPIDPGSDYQAKVLSKLRRKSGFPGSFHFFSPRRLKKISSIVAEKADPGADYDFFHGSTPWILFDSPRPYFVYVDTCFSTYVDVYHDRAGFDRKDLERIFDTESNWLSRASGVFFGTQWALEQVVNDYTISRANLKVVGAAGSMTVPKLDRYQAGINLLFIAFDFEQKGGRICADAFRKVKNKFPETQLTIVGGRPNAEILDRPGVNYEGFLSKSIPADFKRLEELYATAFALIHPTSSDIQPLVISEAGYFGCPSMAPASFGIPELIEDGVTGFLMALPLNADEFANRIMELATNKARYREMRHAVRANAVANQTWHAVGDRIAREMAHSSGNDAFGANG